MKIAAKILLIISMAVGGLLAILGLGIVLVWHVSTQLTVIGIVCIVAGIAVLVLNNVAISKINDATTRDELVVWGVAAIFFSGIVSGVLILLIPDEELDPVGKQVEAYLNAKRAEAQDKKNRNDLPSKY